MGWWLGTYSKASLQEPPPTTLPSICTGHLPTIWAGPVTWFGQQHTETSREDGRIRKPTSSQIQQGNRTV